MQHGSGFFTIIVTVLYQDTHKDKQNSVLHIFFSKNAKKNQNKHQKKYHTPKKRGAQLHVTWFGCPFA